MLCLSLAVYDRLLAQSLSFPFKEGTAVGCQLPETAPPTLGLLTVFTNVTLAHCAAKYYES